jgi:tetratricopeptide (TPR) repeat protein
VTQPFRHFAVILLASLAAFACSSEKKSVTSRTFHDLTAHYNGYFYAREKIREVEVKIFDGQDDDYSNILSLLPVLDSASAKAYAKDLEEAIKMASISIQRHPNSRWADDAYVAVGLARLYGLDWGNAITTFKYVNTNSKDPALQHQALIYLLRTFTEHREFDNAEAVVTHLEKQKLSAENRKNFLIHKAYYCQRKDDYDNMVRSLTQADPLLNRKDRRGRVYFVIGQVYQKLGFDGEAHNYYRKCLATHPEYEVDFYARLNMAQVTRLQRPEDVRNAEKQFRILLNDSKNRDFKDRIYFELGEFRRKLERYSEALESYFESAHAGKSNRTRGMAYLRMGEIHYLPGKDFEKSKLYYDSAVAFLPKEVEGYAAIKSRQEVLGDFVKYNQTVAWQDSLLALAKLDTATLHFRIDSALAAREVKPSGRRSKKRTATEASPSGTVGQLFPEAEEGTTDWYFGNPSAVALGHTEFVRIWGNIPLEDNWRRSARTAVTAAVIPEPGQASETRKADEESATPEAKRNQKYRELLTEIPYDSAKRASALAKIEESYYKLGDIYYFKLDEKENARRMFEMLLQRFPGTPFTADAYYKLYLIFLESDPVRAQAFADKLILEYPDSQLAKALRNPDYLKELSVAEEKQKLLYAQAYALYTSEDFIRARKQVELALQAEPTSFTPHVELLGIMITGKTERIDVYQQQLEQFIRKYPESPLKALAESMKKSSELLEEPVGLARAVSYTDAFQQPHYFALVYAPGERPSGPFLSWLEKFQEQAWKGSPLSLSTLDLSEKIHVVLVSGFPDRNTAVDYYTQFTETPASALPESRHKFNTFVITHDNFDILFRTKALDEYIAFFNRFYKKTSP